MEAGHDLRLAFGHVEGRAVGFGDAGNEVHQEQRQQRQPEPVQQTALLSQHDLVQIQAAGGHQHAHQSEAHGDFVGDDLRRRPHRAEEGILGVGRPAGDDHAVDAQRGQRQQVQQPGIQIGNHHAVAEGHDCPGRDRRSKGQHRRQQEQKAIRPARNDDFLEHQLHGVGDGLQPALGTDPVRTQPNLHVTNDLALGKGQIRHAHQQRHQQDDDFQQDNDDRQQRFHDPLS